MNVNVNEEYRPNVAAIIVSSKYPTHCEIFVAERCDIDGAWQFPQGGIDAGESPKDALFRELEEEIGTNSIQIIAEYPDWVTYDFPPNVQETMKPYKGQKQRYYLVRLDKDAKINLDTHHPEFKSHDFVGLDKLFSVVSHFKRPVYKEVVKYFQKEGYL